ncbi:nanos homolog 2 [Paralichthys olivaceus]|uniref:nanos homolog 2 n=1 Tax=Paralichthys olivaceus TaxID=8255 RepID=UPI00097D3BD0|nr:PREDICTED: nanos homolog 2-like [Paralichthys olivaceus]
MTTLQGEVQGSLFTDGDGFDMWHDYMNLGRLLERLCVRREAERTDREGPQLEPVAHWSLFRTLSDPREEDNKLSAETSSASSLSDTSCGASVSSDHCRFCKQNGESPRVYRSHRLKSNDGKVTCPILRKYTCPTCEATGDQAHTRRYCPQTQRRGGGKMLSRSRFW